MRTEISLININIVVVLYQSLNYLGFCSDILLNEVCRVIVDIAYCYVSSLFFENKKGGYLIKRTSLLSRMPFIKYAQNQTVGKQTNIKLLESKKANGKNRMARLVYGSL